jgi:hypothetical protein
VFCVAVYLPLIFYLIVDISSDVSNKYINAVTYVFFLVPLYRCKTWSLTLRVFKKWVLRIFGPKRDEVTGEWRRLHNMELYALYFSPNITRALQSRRLMWAGHVARMGEMKVAYRVLVGNRRKGDHLE